eukprot:jgi/Psemu1/34515/gm1.34515_g
MHHQVGPPAAPTPLKTDNMTAQGILVGTIKQKRSKAIDMHFTGSTDYMRSITQVATTAGCGLFTCVSREGGPQPYKAKPDLMKPDTSPNGQNPALLIDGGQKGEIGAKYPV